MALPGEQNCGEAQVVIVVGKKRDRPAERPRDRLGQPEALGDLMQHDHAAVRRQGAGMVAVSGLPSGDRQGKINVAFMATGGGSGGDAHELLRHQIPTPTQRLRRRPSTLLALPHE